MHPTNKRKCVVELCGTASAETGSMKMQITYSALNILFQVSGHGGGISKETEQEEE